MAVIGNTPGVSSQRTVQSEIITGSPKSVFIVTSGYSLGYIDVFVNGVQQDESDFTAADGVTVTLAIAAAVGDVVRIVAWLPRGLSDGYLKSESDARFLNLAGGTITANSSTDALRITQTGSGNALYVEDVAADATPFVVSSTGAVGIGTTTPDNITSAGIALVSNNGFFPQIVKRNKANDSNSSYLVFDKDRAGAIVQNGDSLGNIVWRSFDGTNYLQSAAIIGYSDGAPGTNDVPGRLSFFTTADGASSPTERMRLDQAGNLGLGVTPSAWSAGRPALEFGGSVQAAIAFNGNNGNGGAITANAFFNGSNWIYKNSVSAAMYQNAGGTHAWFTAPSGTAGNAISFTQAMTLDASSNLNVNGTVSVNNKSAYIINSGVGTGYIGGLGNGGNIFGSGTDNDIGLTTAGATNLRFGTNNTERARIDSSGNLLVGTTSQLAAGRICLAFSGSTNQGWVSNDTGGGSGSQHMRFLSAGTNVGNISTTTTATSYNTSSDYRLKENIQPMTGALAKVAALKPCTYKWKADGSDGEGFIAHELAEVVPQCVTGEKDAVDAEGNPVYQGIDTSFLVATLTAAIQELKAIVDAQAERIAVLEAK